MRKRVFILVISLLLLTGCASSQVRPHNAAPAQTEHNGDTNAESSEQTVKDQIEQLEQQAAELQDQLEQMTEEQGSFDVVKAFISGYGIDTEGKLDGVGMYLPYTGGKMELELFLRAEGLQEEGVAVMLFLDGQPQPYALAESGKTAYQHTVYPAHNQDSAIGISFTPVTGKAGDMLELCILYLPSYDCTASPDGIRAWYQEDGAKFFMVRIKMEETPGTCVLPEITDRLVEWNISYEEATPADGGDYWNAYFNNKTSGSVIKGFDSTKPLDFQFVMYCNSGDSYALTVYVDGEPILYDAWSLVDHPDCGKIIEAQIDCPDLEGEQMVFAVLLNRNYWGEGIGWENYPDENCLKVIHLNTGE